MRTTAKLISAAALALCASWAQAAPLTCGGPTGTRTVTVDPADACTASGLGNLGDGDAAAVVGGTLVNRDASNSNGGALNITGVGASSGTWSVASSLWSTYADLFLYFHFGNGNPTDPTFNPDWFVVSLEDGATSGTWSVNPTQLTLSNIAVVGAGTPQQRVPEPAAMSLMGLGLGILGISLARRRRSNLK